MLVDCSGCFVPRVDRSGLLSTLNLLRSLSRTSTSCPGELSPLKRSTFLISFLATFVCKTCGTIACSFCRILNSSTN